MVTPVVVDDARHSQDVKDEGEDRGLGWTGYVRASRPQQASILTILAFILYIL
jgi:hypothetical protein